MNNNNHHKDDVGDDDNHSYSYIINRGVYPNLFQSAQSAAGLEGLNLKPTANGRYLSNLQIITLPLTLLCTLDALN